MAVLEDSGECNSHRGLRLSAKRTANTSKRRAAQIALWCSGLTRRPVTAKSAGSNPVRAAINTLEAGEP